MNLFSIELQKQKRTGALAVLPAVGVLGAAYAWANFMMRRDALLSLPLAPMDVLLTQLYGVILVLNLFGIVMAACMSYNMEFAGNAVKKMYLLPVSAAGVYLCKFLLLSGLLLAAVALQGLALAGIGLTVLPKDVFEWAALVRFEGYAFITSMPVLSFMLAVSSRFEALWMPLGAGVAGFLSGIALANTRLAFLLAHPFILMFRPAVTLRAQPEGDVAAAALLETLVFLAAGLWMAKHLRYE